MKRLLCILLVLVLCMSGSYRRAKDIEFNHMTKDDYEFLVTELKSFPKQIQIKKKYQVEYIQDFVNELARCLGQQEEIAFLTNVKFSYVEDPTILYIDLKWSDDMDDIHSILQGIVEKIGPKLEGKSLVRDLLLIRSYFSSWSYNHEAGYLGGRWKGDLLAKQNNCQGFTILLKEILLSRGYHVDYMVGMVDSKKKGNTLHAWIEVVDYKGVRYIVEPMDIFLKDSFPLCWTSYEEMEKYLKLDPITIIFKE